MVESKRGPSLFTCILLHFKRTHFFMLFCTLSSRHNGNGCIQKRFSSLKITSISSHLVFFSFSFSDLILFYRFQRRTHKIVRILSTICNNELHSSIHFRCLVVFCKIRIFVHFPVYFFFFSKNRSIFMLSSFIFHFFFFHQLHLTN